MKRRTRHALLAMFDSPLNVELRNVDIASFYPTERYIQKLVLGIEPVQSGTGDPSPDNVRPISGFTGLTAYRTGKNMLDTNERANLGNSNIHFYFTNGLLLKAGQAYTFSVSQTAAQLTFMAMDGTVLAIAYSTTSKTYTPSEDVLVKFDVYYTGQYSPPSGGLSEVDCQLELGSTASSYEAFGGTTLPVSWQSEAGTVYAGYLSIDKDGNCTLTGTMAYDQMTYAYLSGLTSAYIGYGQQTWDDAVRNVVWVRNWNYSIAAPRVTDGIEALCNAFKVSMHNTTFISTQYRTYFDVGNMTSVADFLSAVQTLETNGSGLFIAFELATPVTYTLSSVTPIATIRPGINNVWCDTGPVIELIS